MFCYIYISETMSDAYSEHIAILKGLLLSQQWLKQSIVGLSKQPFPHVWFWHLPWL